MDPRVDDFLDNATLWKTEMRKLREIALECGLTEDVKWNKPCYSFGKSNILIIQDFKAYCAYMFFKGILLKDDQNILTKTGEHTHVGRQIRFTDIRKIIEMESILKAYLFEATEVEKAGLKVEPINIFDYPVPVEFQEKLDQMPILKTAFESLTPGKQKAYLIYFSQAKQSKTRESRVNKYIPQILLKKGIND